MQIFELTQSKKLTLNELDFSGSQPKKNFGTGVGPGVQPQYTATPRMKGDPQPGPAPQLPPPTGRAVATVPVAAQPPTIDAPAQLTGPAAQPQLGTNYDPNVIDVDAKVKPETPAPAATALPAPAPAPAVAPAPAPATTAPATAPAPAPAPATTAPATAPAPAPATAEIDPELAVASKVKMTGPQGQKANYGDAFAKAINAYNANKVGLGFMLSKKPDQEVYTDPKGKITVGGQPYDASNPEHQRIVGTITIGGKPYNANNANHQAAYLAFLKTAGRGNNNLFQIDNAGKASVAGQPFDPSNINHLMAYKQYQLSQLVRQSPPPPVAQQSPAAATGSPEVTQALTSMGYTPQQAAALAAKVPQGTSTADAVKQILQGRISESLSWSRNFDPSRTLLKKIRQP